MVKSPQSFFILCEALLNSHDDLFDRIAHDLRVEGLSIQSIPQDMPALDALTQRLRMFSTDEFSAAGIGRQADHTQNATIRRDRIHWLDTSEPLERTFLTFMEQLKNHLNHLKNISDIMGTLIVA